MIRILERFPEGTEFIEIKGLADLLSKSYSKKTITNFKNSVKNKIVFVNLSYVERVNHSFIREGDSIEDLLISAALPEVNGQELKLDKIPNEIKYFLDTVDFIDLSYNSICEIPDWFICTKLKGLYLEGNKLIEFPKIVRQFHSLEDLDLRFNKIKSIDKTEFLKNNTRLKYLNLSYNELDSIEFFVFNLRQLQFIELSGNYFETFSEDFFRGNSNLEYIGFSDSQASSIPDFRFTPKLRSLSLQGHQVGSKLKEGLGGMIEENIDSIFPEGKPFEVFDYFEDIGLYDLKNLEYLNLSDNQLRVLPRKFFHLQSIKHMDLSENDFSYAYKKYIKQMFPNVDKLLF